MTRREEDCHATQSDSITEDMLQGIFITNNDPKKPATKSFGSSIGEMMSLLFPDNRIEVSVVEADMSKVALVGPGDTLVISLSKPVVGERRNSWITYAERLRCEFGLKVVILEDVLQVSIVKSGQQE
ncbi:MAG: hypothetical protein AB7E12_14820 [Burkholderiaceae bacterium]